MMGVLAQRACYVLWLNKSLCAGFQLNYDGTYSQQGVPALLGKLGNVHVCVCVCILQLFCLFIWNLHFSCFNCPK